MGFLLESRGFTVFQNFLSLSIVFDCIDIKYCLLAWMFSFKTRFLCSLYFLTSSSRLLLFAAIFKIDLFLIAFRKSLFICGLSLALTSFGLVGAFALSVSRKIDSKFPYIDR